MIAFSSYVLLHRPSARSPRNMNYWCLGIAIKHDRFFVLCFATPVLQNHISAPNGVDPDTCHPSIGPLLFPSGHKPAEPGNLSWLRGPGSFFLSSLSSSSMIFSSPLPLPLSKTYEFNPHGKFWYTQPVPEISIRNEKPQLIFIVLLSQLCFFVFSWHVSPLNLTE